MCTLPDYGVFALISESIAVSNVWLVILMEHIFIKIWIILLTFIQDIAKKLKVANLQQNTLHEKQKQRQYYIGLLEIKLN